MKRIPLLSFLVALGLLSFSCILRRRRAASPAPVEPWAPTESVHDVVPQPGSPVAEPAPGPETAATTSAQAKVAPTATDEAPAAPAPDPVPAPAEPEATKTPWFAPDPLPPSLPVPEPEWEPEPSPEVEWDPVEPGAALVTDVPAPEPHTTEPPPPPVMQTPASHLRVVEPEEVRFRTVEPSSAAPEPAAIPAADEPDFLTTYFDKLAKTPDSELLGHLARNAELADDAVPEKSAELPLAPLPETSPGEEATQASPVSVVPPTETPERVEATTPTAPQPLADVHLPKPPEEAPPDLSPVPNVPPPRRTAESYLDEGNVYFNVSQYGLAIERYTAATDMDPNLVAAFYNRANAWTRTGEFDAALADYNRALELQPEDADALNNRGMLHLYRANYDDAMRDFDAALVIDPGDATVMVNRGLANLHSGDPAAALVDFQEAAALDGSDAAAAYGAAQAAAVLGNRDEALRHVARALGLNPGYAQEAAADPNLAVLQGDAAFLKLLRENGPRQA